jgi:hypothetical protein
MIKEIIAERCKEALEILPPALWLANRILLGEPASHRRCKITNKVLPTYSAFFFAYGRYYESDPMTGAGVSCVQRRGLASARITGGVFLISAFGCITTFCICAWVASLANTSASVSQNTSFSPSILARWRLNASIARWYCIVSMLLPSSCRWSLATDVQASLVKWLTDQHGASYPFIIWLVRHRLAAHESIGTTSANGLKEKPVGCDRR